MPAPLIGVTTRSSVLPGSPAGARAQTSPEAYVRAVAGAGGRCVLIPSCLAPEEAVEVAGRLDGILLSGGCDVSPFLYGHDPGRSLGNVDIPRDRMEIGLARAAAERGIPLFGICRGLQVMNVALGGTLIQDLPSAGREMLHDVTVWTDGPAHRVEVVEGTLLRRILGVPETDVNSSHHQAADRLGEGLVVSARARDGTVEALERRGSPFYLGVQWHPERSLDWSAGASALFAAFLEACR